MPAPVIVKVLPESVAGPETMTKLTGKPEEAVAVSANGAAPLSFASQGAKSDGLIALDHGEGAADGIAESRWRWRSVVCSCRPNQRANP